MKKGQKISSPSKPMRVPIPLVEELNLEFKIRRFRLQERLKGLPLELVDKKNDEVTTND